MAANSGATDSTGRKNYYNIAYGMLSTNAKDAPEGFEKISLAELKAKRQKNENVDLRRKYYDTENGKDYPLRVFYTDITGIIEGVEKDEYDQGVSLKVTLHDQDGDESILQTDFYGKVAADFLNRLINVNPANELNFRPYSIPTKADINGEERQFYNSGVSIKDGGTKIERSFNKDNGLPETEQVTNSKGKSETSRVKQINFLWEKVQAKFAEINSANSTASTETASAPTQQGTAQKAETTEKQQPATQTVPTDDLPF